VANPIPTRHKAKIKALLFVLVCAETLVWSQTIAFAADQNSQMKLSSQQDESNSQFSIGLEAGSLALQGASLSGIGLRLGYEYGLTQNWSIHPDLSLVFSTSGTQGFLYTGFDGFFRYNIFGDFKLSRSTLYDQGNSVVQQSSLRGNRFTVGAGVAQLFLNGAEQVYPAAGVGLEASYSFSAFHHWVETSVRGMELTANSKSFSAIFVNLSFLLGL
jgi:hypothetical protein